MNTNNDMSATIVSESDKENPMNNQFPTVESTTLNILDRKVTFVGGKSLWKVNITGNNGKTVTFSGIDLCKGVLNALSHLHTGSYCYNEFGLHLKKSPEELMILGAADEVGYVRYHYDGSIEIEGIERLKDGDLCGSVSYRDGRLRVSRIVRNAEYEKGENDAIKHDRNTFNLFCGLELIEAGYHIVLTPRMKQTTSREGVVTTGATHVDALLSHHRKVLSSAPEEARSIVFAAVAKNTTRTQLGKEYRKVAAAQEAGETYVPNIATVGVITSLEPFTIEQTPAEKLQGLVGYLFKGRFPVSTLRNLDDAAVLATIKARNLLVMINE